MGGVCRRADGPKIPPRLFSVEKTDTFFATNRPSKKEAAPHRCAGRLLFLVQMMELDLESLNTILVGANFSMRLSKPAAASAPQELHGFQGLACNQGLDMFFRKRGTTLYQWDAEPAASAFIGADVVVFCRKDLSGSTDGAFADPLLGMDIFTLCGPLLLVIHRKGRGNLTILEDQSCRICMPIFGGQLLLLRGLAI